jgi:hypothetical protein
MADKIYSMWMDEAMRKDLVQKGYKKIRYLTQEHHAKIWEECITDTMNKIQRM